MSNTDALHTPLGLEAPTDTQAAPVQPRTRAAIMASAALLVAVPLVFVALVPEGSGGEPTATALIQLAPPDAAPKVAMVDPEPVARATTESVAVEAWRALQDRPGNAAAPLPLATLDQWVRTHRGRLSDPLALSVAIDTVRNEPTCQECRQRLRALLWSALDRPGAAVQRRQAPPPRGQRYLEALR